MVKAMGAIQHLHIAALSERGKAVLAAPVLFGLRANRRRTGSPREGNGISRETP